MPTVTVTIPTYNRSGLLRRALQSVLDQSFTDFEVFVSDNASTADTAAVVASFGDPRVHYAPLEENVGMVPNLTRCLGLGQAPYFMMFHDDDLMRPGHLAACVGVLDAHPEVVIVHSAFSLIDGDDNVFVDRTAWGLPIEPMEPPGVFIRRCFTMGNRVSPSGTLVRRSALAGQAYEAEDGAANDMGLWLRVARQGMVAFLPEPTLALRKHSGQVTSQLATNVDAGGEEFLDSFEGIAQSRRAKLRFASRFDHDPVDGRELRRLARWRARAELGVSLRRQVRGAESTGGRIALCREALAIEPAVLLSADAGEAFAATVLGERAADAMARVRPAARRVVQRVARRRAGAASS